MWEYVCDGCEYFVCVFWCVDVDCVGNVDFVVVECGELFDDVDY